MTDLNQGMKSRELGDKGIREIWDRCDKLNAKRKADTGFYVPWRAVVVKPELLPRKVDPEVVERYAAADVHLSKAAKVQKDTLVLFDGLHRRSGAPKASCDYMLVEEHDIPDEGLALAAFEANLDNGLPYTSSQRVAGARLMLIAHPELSNTLIGHKCGIDPDTVAKHRRQLEAYANRTVGADGRETVAQNQNADLRVRKLDPQPARATKPETARDMRHEPLSRTPEPNYFDPDEWGESDAVAPDFDEPARQVLEEIGYASVGPPEGERPDTGAFAGEVAWPGAAEAARKLDALEPRATATNYVEVRQPVFQAWMDAVLMLGDVPEGGTEKQYRYAANVFEALRADCLKFWEVPA